MIMIIGSQHDDILYFESVMSNKREEVVLDKYKVTIGTIFNQSVILVDQVKTNYVSSVLTLYLIEKYYVFLVFVVGRCIAFTHDIKHIYIDGLHCFDIIIRIISHSCFNFIFTWIGLITFSHDSHTPCSQRRLCIAR